MLVDMTKIHVIGHRHDLDAVVAVLQGLQAVHLIDVTQDREVHLPPLSVDEDQLAELQDARYLRARIDSLLALVPVSPRPPVIAEPVDLAVVRRELDTDGPEIERLVRELEDLSAERESLPRHISALERLLPLLPDAAMTGGYETAAVLIDSHFPEVLGALDAELMKLLDGNYEIISDRVDPDTIGAVVVFPQRSSVEVRGLLGRGQLSRVRLPTRFTGMSFRHALTSMRRRLHELPVELDHRRAQIEALVAPHGVWVAASRQLADRMDQLAAVRLIGATTHTFVVCGWVPAPRLDDVREALSATTHGSAVLIDSAPGHDDVPPVLLDNPPIARPFEIFIRLLSVPMYGGFDPTLLMLAFMPLFIGMMLGDIVYGSVLLVITVVVGHRFADRPGAVRDISRILTLSAGWSIVWGVIYGEFLGDLGHRWFGLEPIWVNREEALEPLLVFSLGIGAAHVVLGLLLGIWTASRTDQRSKVVERAALLVALVGTFLIVAVVADRLPSGFVTPGVAALIVGLAVLMATGGAMGLLMGPLELLGTLGNVLSYLRIAAIGLASVFLAKVANELGAAAPLLVGILIGTLFHGLNLALGAFSPTIQALRLHYVEFFGKFYEEGGDEYRPFGGLAADTAADPRSIEHHLDTQHIDPPPIDRPPIEHDERS
jgi:V/A-type H+-transporting ATPase subunit I